MLRLGLKRVGAFGLRDIYIYIYIYVLRYLLVDVFKRHTYMSCV